MDKALQQTWHACRSARGEQATENDYRDQQIPLPHLSEEETLWVTGSALCAAMNTILQSLMKHVRAVRKNALLSIFRQTAGLIQISAKYPKTRSKAGPPDCFASDV